MKEERETNQTIVINENFKENMKTENSAKIVDTTIEIKSLGSNEENLLDEIPEAGHNESESINIEIADNSSQSKSKKRQMESTEVINPINSDLKRVKTDHSERRRSLRNETAATIKKKPPKYEEIFNCYRRKEYKECIIYIDLVSEMAKEWIEYQILKAACLIHLGIKLGEAHKILDDVIKIHNSNPFTFYAKGLAYYNEEKWKNSIEYFEKAISLDKSSMQRAEVMLNLAKEELEKSNKENDILMTEIKTEPLDDEFDQDNDANSCENDDPDTQNDSTVTSINRSNRFKCEICNKFFCKKFNLDRHNKIMHDRETPYIPPLPRNYNNRRSAPEALEIKKEDESLTPISESASPISKSARFKIRLGKKKIKRAHSLSTLAVRSEMGRCKICNKLYRKGSLSRHEVIHTGVKQFKCEECPMAFYQKSDLQRHITIHSDVFDYECHLCDKKFRIKKNLQVHNKRHHSK